MSRLARRFLFLVSAVLVTLAIGTVGFVVVAGYPPFDAFYMTLTTMTTVGYQEIHPLGQAGRIFNSFLIVFGVTTSAPVFTERPANPYLLESTHCMTGRKPWR